jgi:TIR domain-containing protein
MTGNIFINYRREESAYVAGRLHDSLAPKFGHNKLFMDVDNIPVGRDFEDYLNSQVAACDAMLAIIGPNWLTAKDETGQRLRWGKHAEGERASRRAEAACP